MWSIVWRAEKNIINNCFCFYFLFFTYPVAKRAVATILPKWPKIYKEEPITFICDIEDEDYDEWYFEWRGRSVTKLPGQQKVLANAYASYNGDYTCVGRKKTELTTMTKWSEHVSLKVHDCK